MKKSVLACLLLIIFSAWLTGCGSETSETIEVEISPDSDSKTIFFSPQSLLVRTKSQFSLKVKITQVNNVFGIGFDLRYNPVFFEWVRVSDEDSFLSDNGQVFLATASSSPGELSFAITRLGKNSGGVSGPGLVAILGFKSLGRKGQSQISFYKNYICILEKDGSHHFENIDQQNASIRVR